VPPATGPLHNFFDVKIIRHGQQHFAHLWADLPLKSRFRQRFLTQQSIDRIHHAGCSQEKKWNRINVPTIGGFFAGAAFDKGAVRRFPVRIHCWYQLFEVRRWLERLRCQFPLLVSLPDAISA